MEAGEAEDVINYVPILDDATGVGPYFEIVPQFESGYPPERQPKSKCSACGRVEVEVIETDTRFKLRMQDEMWKGESLFRLATTLYIVVADEVRKEILRHKPTNLRITDAC